MRTRAATDKLPPSQTSLELPLVSIITVTLNAAETLRDCIRSVQAQDYSAIEHLVVDGGSTDDTISILTEDAAQNLFWQSEPDRGIYDAWNKGLARARGEWIAFLGSDDLYLPGAVSAYMRLAWEHPEAQYLSSRVCWLGPRGQRTIGRPWSWPHFQRMMTVAHVGSMHHRSLFEQYGTYDASLGIVGDYELLLRPKAHLRASFLPQVTAQMRAGGASDAIAALRESLQVKQTVGGCPPLLAQMDYALAQLLFLKRRWFA